MPHTPLDSRCRGLSSSSPANSQHPRLYDGRIHVPLQLMQEHFRDTGVPL